MEKEHAIILLLSILVFYVSFRLVCQTVATKKKEDFYYDYSKATGDKLCKLQADYIVGAPIIGGEKKRKQAYDNCMKHFYGVMPSAYVSSTFKY